MRTALCLIATTLAIALAFVMPTHADETTSLVGKQAPDVSLPTVDGKAIKLSDQKGKVVVVDFWATWCPPCRKSLPHVQKISADKALADKGLVVWAVNAREDKDVVAGFLRDNNYTFTVALDASGSSLKDYFVSGIPTTIVVGRDGTIKKVFVGFDEDSAKEIDDAVNEALAESAH
jgi:peroxiredoxin